MKTMNFLNLKNISSITGITIAIITIMLFLSSCTKSDYNYNNGYVDFAGVEIIHGSASSVALDAAFDNNRLGVGNFTYTDRINYLRVTPGNRNFKVFNSGSSSANPIFAKDLSFDVAKHYSVFIVDTASNMDVIRLRDSSRAAGKDSVRLRFANMSTNAPAFDLYVKGNTTPIATNITYKNAGDFFSFKSDLNVVFEIKASGQTTVLQTSDPIDLYSSKIYTIWSSGYYNQSGSTGSITGLRINRFTHNPIFY